MEPNEIIKGLKGIRAACGKKNRAYIDEAIKAVEENAVLKLGDPESEVDRIIRENREAGLRMMKSDPPGPHEFI